MTQPHVLIVDDEPDIRALLEITLSRMNIKTFAAQNLHEAKALLAKQELNLCLTDMHLPDGNGIELVDYIQSTKPELPVAMITAFGTMETAIDALKAGAFDYVTKPINLNQLRDLVTNALRLPSDDKNSKDQNIPHNLVGSSPPMQQLASQVSRLSRSQAPVYISGESGAGKEQVAKSIHYLGPRAQCPFIPVNCGAIPSELMESEFFGHKKGSFTGAHDDKPGLFLSADGGTLFLDEVADLPLQMQVKLLRCLQEKSIRPVGAAKETHVNVRILCATHKDLLKEVQAGHFREDLYYRLNVIELRVPPLRERKSDLTQLCDFLMSRITNNWGTSNVFHLSDAARQSLIDYDFPGNVRELENILERAMTLSDNHQIEPQHLQLRMDARVINPGVATSASPPASQAGQSSICEQPSFAEHSLPEGTTLENYLMEIEKNILLQSLEETRWNRTAAAKTLGLSFRSLRYRLKKLGIEDDNEQNDSE